MTGLYQPDRGHFVYLDFTPNAGTEQGGRRPALVLSPKKFNIATSLAVVCPCTTKIKQSPWEVPISKGSGISGVVLSNQFRSVDWLARGATFHSEASDEVMAEVLGRIEAILSLDCS